METAHMLEQIFKAYDVRGTVPDQLNEDLAAAIGVGFARFAIERGGATRVLVGRDMRTSGPGLAEGLMRGVASLGLGVVDLGLCSTDLLYFASGSLDAPGVMITASHNPARYNGMKFCLAGAKPVGEESGLAEVRAYAAAAGPVEGTIPPGALEERDLLPDFARHVRSFVALERLRPLGVVADTANGMGGLVAPAVFSELPFRLEILFGELDGSFPNHPADPIQAENLVDLVAAVTRSGADVGLAFDGDADRVFLVDDAGVPLSGSTTTAIVAQAMLAKYPGAAILYNCICSRAVPEVIAENGGTGIRTRVGHSFIKGVMAETDAVFGGEHSGHYYFRDNFRADSGIIAALVVLELLCEADEPLSVLRKPFERYAASGEINTAVADPHAVIERVAARYGAAGAEIDRLDGLTASFPEWWFNLRPSNTEPLLRLNVEAADPSACSADVAEVLAAVADVAGPSQAPEGSQP